MMVMDQMTSVLFALSVFDIGQSLEHGAFDAVTEETDHPDDRIEDAR